MTKELTPDQKVIYAVGAMILCYQAIERHLKFIVPFTDSNAPDLTSMLARRKELAKKTLGEVTGKFVDAARGDTEALRKQLKSVVDKRNELAHHFLEIYGPLIESKNHDQVLNTLETQRQEAVSTLTTLQEMAIAILEMMRDSLPQDTESYDELVALCASARSSLVRQSS